MYTINKFFTRLSSAIHSRSGRIAIMVLAMALFILSAGAPSATIGIGK